VHGMIQSGAKGAHDLSDRHCKTRWRTLLELGRMDIDVLFEIEAWNMKVGSLGDKLPNCYVQPMKFIPPIC
jgi:hypothetical protein